MQVCQYIIHGNVELVLRNLTYSMWMRTYELTMLSGSLRLWFKCATSKSKRSPLLVITICRPRQLIGQFTLMPAVRFINLQIIIATSLPCNTPIYCSRQTQWILHRPPSCMDPVVIMYLHIEIETSSPEVVTTARFVYINKTLTNGQKSRIPC